MESVTPAKFQRPQFLREDLQPFLIKFFLAAFIALGSLIMWRTLNLLVIHPYALILNLPSYWQELTTLWLAWTLLSGLLVLVILIVHPIQQRIVLYLVAALGIFTLNIDWIYQLIVTLLFWSALVVFDIFSQRDISLHNKINLTHIFGAKLRLITAVTALIIAMMFYLSSLAQLPNIEVKLPTALIDQAIQLSTPILQDQITNQESILMDSAIGQIEEQLPTLKGVPREDKEALIRGEVTPVVRTTLQTIGISDSQIDAFASQIKTAVPSTTNGNIITLDEKNPIIQQVRTQMEQLVEKVISEHRDLIPWFISVTTFLTISSVSFLLNLVTLSFTAILLHLLLALKVVEQVVEQTTNTRYKINPVVPKSTSTTDKI